MTETENIQIQMSSNILIERVCIYCNSKFIAKTTKTKYCSHRCNQRHYKQLDKEEKVAISHIETKITGTLRTKIDFPILSTKELLTITEASAYLNITHVTLRRWIKEGRITSSRIGKKYLIRRTSIDGLIS